MKQRVGILLLAAVLMLLSSSCSSGGGVSSTVGTVNGDSKQTITPGNWSLVTASQIQHGSYITMGGALTSSGSDVSIMLTPASPCLPIWRPSPFTGTTSDDTITLTSPSAQGRVMTITGTTYNGTNIGGNYEIAGGTGACNGDQGTVYGTLVPSVSGNWAGQVTEVDPNALPSDIPNTVAVAASISQATDAAANGSFPLSGTMTFQGTTCFSSGTIDPALSSIAGGAMTMVVDADGGATVTFPGVNLLNPNVGTTMSIVYQVSGGICDGFTAGTLGSAGTLNKL